ncbi:MAG: Crp/Fnr family transcriptional regulator [Bacillales bacterium]|jgi:CRP/FNR family transcriptional regulator|nr:Crp/Fnr family transcriptional regulator [Bacillales bacterium]
MEENVPFWSILTDLQKEKMIEHSYFQNYKEGTIMNYSGDNCTGVQIIKSGRAKVFISSPDGRAITLYRLLDRDVCMLSAGCMLKNLNFGVNLEAETDCEAVVIDGNVYQEISEENSAVKDFTLAIVSSKFSEVMWLLEHLVFSNVGKRLASSLLEQKNLLESNSLSITHEKLATDLGTAREVVTRLLKQFQLDGLVELSRGKIKIVDEKSLIQLSL